MTLDKTPASIRTMFNMIANKYDFVNSIEDRNTVLNMIEQTLVAYGKLTQSEFEQIKAERAEKFNDPAPEAD